jgi:hypothetical protein
MNLSPKLLDVAHKRLFTKPSKITAQETVKQGSPKNRITQMIGVRVFVYG